MSIRTTVEGWHASGLLDEARQTWCDALRMQMLSSEQLGIWFDAHVAVLGMVAARNIGEEAELSPAVFTEFIRGYVVENRVRCIETCMALSDSATEEERAEDFKRIVENLRWQQEAGGGDEHLPE